ncbi:hypothetical protein ACVXG8_00600 [Escherichia coli]
MTLRVGHGPRSDMEAVLPEVGFTAPVKGCESVVSRGTGDQQR